MLSIRKINGHTVKKLLNKMEELAEKYVSDVRQHLTEKHGMVKPEWEGLLKMLEYEYHLFLTARQEILANGLTVTTGRGAQPSPYINIMQTASAQCQKILSDFGCNPKTCTKVKAEEKEDNDFINSMLL